MKSGMMLRLLLSVSLFASSMIGGSHMAKALPSSGLVLDYALNRAFNGTSDFVDKTADLGMVSGLTEGSIAVKFKTASTAQAKTFLSGSDTSDPSSNISFTMNNGTVYFENRENGTYATRLSATGTYNDGNWHTAVLTVNSSGTKIYVDGMVKGTEASTAFFTNVTNLNGLWVGKNVDNGGSQWFYGGEMDYLKVYHRALTDTEAQQLAGILPDTAVSYTINQTFNGTSDFVDKTSDLGTVSGLTQGAIAVKFKSSSTAQAKTFLSASDTSDPSSNISFTMNNGTVYFENREKGTYATRLSAAGTYNDGKWHTAVLNVDNSGSKIYVDGYEQASSSSRAFFTNVTNLNGMWIGKNVDNGGNQWFYAGEMDFLNVYNTPLTDPQIKQISSKFEDNILFDINDGKGYTQYRIPSIAVMADGTVLVAVEGRSGDDQSPTDIVLRRSTDGGKTFSDNIILAPGKSQGYAEMNPMLLAENTGSTVHLLWSRWKWGSCQYFIRTSHDNGVTWDEARDISNVLDAYKNPSNPNYFANLSGAGMGPGHGIQLKDGTLMVPIYFTTPNWSNSTVATIYSNDGGATWQAGTKVPNPTGYTKIHENMMVQLSNGSLMTNMRNPSTRNRAVSTASGVTGTWTTPYSDQVLIDPVCQASIQRYDDSTILFTNAASTSSRTHMTIRMSNDDGATWYKSKEIYAGTNGYSDIGVSPDKSIYVFYEKPAAQKISLAIFNKAWVEAP
ncbi:sialidase family protein [Paenibacillus chibensis]|uniref:sialidase family protein n=1 Tax=Paenibacillus chibensis TaxID=59846 RepID=UPI000FD74663|nr:sialidase family protein [Paenibacillus chibensis]MEC0371314.1 exo-alpha-sialidase [Paenibacillus chibensis]